MAAKLDIFDVQHGACALITTAFGEHIMIDCGHRSGQSANTSRERRGLGDFLPEPHSALSLENALMSPPAPRRGLGDFFSESHSALSLANALVSPPPQRRGLGALSDVYAESLSASALANVLMERAPGRAKEWRPSDELLRRGVEVIDELIVSNYDLDHVSDFQNICGNIFVANIQGNPTLTMDRLEKIKERTGGIGTGGLSVMMDLLRYSRHTFKPRQIRGATIRYYWIEYHPNGPLFGTNNLSLITFIQMGDLRILFPGDLEPAAWRKAIQYPFFRSMLQQVNVLVASHHGRETGYCADIFGYGLCNPELVIISDKPIEHGTQESSSALYGRHASGVNFGGNIRRVLSTRRDGNITVTINDFGGATVSTQC